MRVLNHRGIRVVVFLATLFTALVLTRKASALPDGLHDVSSSGCNSCHGGAGTWTFSAAFGTPSGGNASLVGTTWYVDPNTDIFMNFTVDSPSKACAWKGFFVKTDSGDVGTLTATSGNAWTKPADSGGPATNSVTHNAPQKACSAATFGFKWHSPNAFSKTSTLIGWGNTVDDPTFTNVSNKTYITFRTRDNDGSGCTIGATCRTRNCVDGTCCNSGCSGECNTCAGGTCGVLFSKTTRSGAACPGTGPCSAECRGSSSCTYASASTVCVGASCDPATSIAVKDAFCNGSGTCVPGATENCAPNACNAVKTGCGTGCSTDAECSAGSYCSSSNCLVKKDNGAACSAINQCKSNFCVDGVCCNNICDGQCSSCNGTTPGTCSAVTGAPTGGRPACATDGISTCGGACGGTSLGACVYPTSECRPASCDSGVAILAANCDGAGTCPLTTTKVCTPYTCKGTSCATTCVVDGDCGASSYCKAGVCTPKSVVGDGCATDAECSTGLCVDGACCNTACTGQCEACDVLGKVGTCVNVTDAPHGKRAACELGTDGCPTACNGTIGATCSPASCDAGADATADATDDTAATSEAGETGGGDAGGEAGDDALTLPDALKSDTAGEPTDEVNENANCACRTTGRPRAPYGFALFGLGLGALILRQRRRRPGL
jgi:MYXO-CTERM domain-containing protein